MMLNEFNKLVDLSFVIGTLSIKTIKGKEQDLQQSKKNFTEALENDTNQLNSLPDIDSIKVKAIQ